MRRLFWITVFTLLLATPILLVFVNTPRVRTLLPFGKPSVSSKYSVESDVKGYAVTLADTSYLDYITAKMNLFDPNAVVDATFYTKKLKTAKRFQINHIIFFLVNQVEAPISIVSMTDGTRVTVDCQGEYSLRGNTLVDRVRVGFDTLGKQLLMDKFAWESSFLRCALNTLYYAKGVTDPALSYQELVNIKDDLDKNVYSGLFAWPFHITGSSL